MRLAHLIHFRDKPLNVFLTSIRLVAESKCGLTLLLIFVLECIKEVRLVVVFLEIKVDFLKYLQLDSEFIPSILFTKSAHLLHYISKLFEFLLSNSQVDFLISPRVFLLSNEFTIGKLKPSPDQSRLL